MKNTMIIRKSLVVLFTLIFISASAFASAVVRAGSGGSNDILTPFTQFVGDLGGSDRATGGSYASGYRVIQWDEVPENIASGSLPPDFFNTNVQRGVMLSSPCSDDDFKVSASQGSGLPMNFGNYNAHYSTDFNSFGGPRLFSVLIGGCNYVDVTFYIPGTKVPATVNGFSAVFSDVDTNTSTGMKFYGIDGRQLMPRQNVNSGNNGFSFLGVSFNAGERIARVRIFSGTGVLGDLDKSRGGTFDVVVMDTMIYGEPRAIGHHANDFDGDGTSDYAVFRPSNGVWYVMQSGSNTFTASQFGSAGDVPVDGDFDGDSRSDLAVFRPGTGVWYILRTSNGQAQIAKFGMNGDKPVAGDYDKDGKTDITVWRPSDGNYYSLNSSDGQAKVFHFGANGDIPIGSAAP